jgi:dipeptidyl aminopeptidase/acylaminoacyl peptidase
MVAALKARDLQVEYVLYEGEQHGFRKAETLVDSLNRELGFYQRVFYPPGEQ